MWLVFRELPIFQTVSAQVVEEEEKFSVHVYRDLPREVDGSLSCSGHVLFSIIGDGLNPMRTYLDYLVGMNIHQLFWCSPGYQGLDPQPIGDMLESFVPTDTRESPLPSSSIGGYHPIFFSDFFHQTSTYLKVFFGAFVVCRSDENFLATWSGVLHGIWDHSPTPDLSGIRCSLAGSVSRWAPGRESASAHGTLLPLLRFTRISCLDGLDGWFAMLEWVNEGQSIHIFYTINIHKLDHHLDKPSILKSLVSPAILWCFHNRRARVNWPKPMGSWGWINDPIGHDHVSDISTMIICEIGIDIYWLLILAINDINGDPLLIPLDPVTCCVAKRPIFMRYHALILRHPPRVQRIWCMEEIMWPVSRELDTCWWFLR